MSLNSDIDQWAQDVVRNVHKSGFSGINVVERILKDPGVATDASKDRILWWPPNRAVARISRAMHRIPVRAQICLIVDSCHILKEDGNIYSEKDLARESTLTVSEIRKYVREAKAKLRRILE
jgi:hypothetical protein